MRTTGNKVIIEPIMQEEQSEGGIIVANSFRGRTAKGKIIAIGDKVKGIPVGCVCHYVKGGGEKIEEGGEYYVLLDIDIRAFYLN